MQEQLFLDQNPWKKNKPLDFLQKTIKRTFSNHLINHLNKRGVPILIGARQTGKSTSLYQVIDYLLNQKKVNPKNIFYFSLDDLELRQELQTNQQALIQYLESWLGQNIADYAHKIYLFIDEAQKAPSIFDTLKLIFDVYKEKIKIILSGSSSLELKRISTESLAGRLVYFYSYPFTIRELYELVYGQKINLPKITKLLNAETKSHLSLLKQRQAELLPNKIKIEKLIHQAITLGSLPPLWQIENLDDKLRFLKNYKTAYIEKDIIFLKEVGNTFDYLKLLEILAAQAGELLNISALSQKIGLSANTVKKYIKILMDTGIVDLHLVYSQNTKVRLIKAPKIFMFDNFLLALADQIIKYNDLKQYNLLGRYAENFLVQEIKKEFLNKALPVKFSFWRTSYHQEVDLIIETAGQIQPFEIKSGFQTARQDLTGLLAFLRHYPKANQGFVLYQGELKQEGNVLFIPFWLMI